MYKNLNVLYTYTVNQNLPNQEINTKVAMQNLCNFAIKAQDIRIAQNEKINNVQEYILDKKYDKTKLETVMEQAIAENAALYGDAAKNEILGKVNGYHQFSRKKIEAMDILAKNYAKFKNMPNGNAIFQKIFTKFKTKNVSQNDMQTMQRRFGIQMDGIGSNRFQISFEEKKKKQPIVPINDQIVNQPIFRVSQSPKEEINVHLNDVDRFIYRGNSKLLKMIFNIPILKKLASRLQDYVDRVNETLASRAGGASNRAYQESIPNYRQTPKKSISLYNIGELNSKRSMDRQNVFDRQINRRKEENGFER